MEKIISELLVRDLSKEDKEEFISKYFEIVESSTSIIKVIEENDKLLIIEDDTNNI